VQIDTRQPALSNKKEQGATNVKNNKKNQKQTPMASNQDEVAQITAHDDVPVIEVVRAEDLDPAAFAAAQEVTGEEMNEIAESAAAVDQFNAENAVAPPAAHTNGAPAPDTTPNADATVTPETPAPAPEKPRVYHLKLSAEQLDYLNLCVSATHEGGGVGTSSLDETAQTGMCVDLQALIAKARTAPASNGSVSTVRIFGKYAPVAILNWMGHRDFTVFDAKNALASFGIEDIEKTTFSRALAKGKDPIKNKVKILDLEPEEELALFEFYNLAAREAARAATAKIDAVKARIQALPTVQQ
jgi:hypothetical protein